MSSSDDTVVLFPSAGMGHLIPFVELAKLFITRNFSVAIIIVETPYTSSINSSFISSVSAAHPSISFHHLHVSPPHPPAFNFHLSLFPDPNRLSALLASLSQKSSIRALILDMFCTSALDVARELGIPPYFFFASNASALSVFVSIPAFVSQQSFRDLGETPVCFPGQPPFPASHMVIHLRQDPDSEQYRHFLYHTERLPKADGIIINTFESLERRAVAALAQGKSFPGCPMPPVYCVGPVVADRGDGEEGVRRHECLRWLDAQPRGSVVFLCFGSQGRFPKAQIEEIAVGLERSGQRFLWVVRGPQGDEQGLDELLPEGFLERTAGRGMVVMSWAPQAAVLRHESVGGFVTHCGWNSTLEAVSSGVPMIAWPLYAEQWMNKVFLVEEAKLAVEMRGYDKESVSAEEVEAKVRWVMESEGGRALRDRAAAMKVSAAAAVNRGGSSEKAWAELVNELKRKV